MTDIFDKVKRSEIMSKISGKDTKPEVLIRKKLFSKGFRFRKNVKTLPGKPDIVLPKYKTTIFVNGCFWHGHGCKKSKLPKTRTDFWKEKINNNLLRDQKNLENLKNDGWQVIIIWQCEISNNLLLNQKIDEISIQLKQKINEVAS